MSEKRKTISVHSDLDRPIMLHLHETVPDDGAGRPFQGRILTSAEDPDLMPTQIQMHPGDNPGIDSEFFEKWKEQNKGFSLLRYFTTPNEDKPKSA